MTYLGRAAYTDVHVYGNVNYVFHLTEADLFCCSTVLYLWKFVSVTELGREKLKFGVISKLQLKSSKVEVIFSILYDYLEVQSY